MTSAPVVQSVARTLALLRHVNRLGSASVGQLHAETGLPKSTIVRLLQTLVQEGYVYKDHRMHGYQVTAEVGALSSGFHSAPMVVQVARPYAIELTRQLRWPTAICTPEQNAVVVRYSTIANSPISPFHSTLGARISLASRALGRAYLAFCSDEERDALINMLADSTDPDDKTPTRAELEQMIALTRERGYAIRDQPLKTAEPSFFGLPLNSSATVAVPLRLDERVLATFGVTYFRSAIPAKQVEAVLVAPLKAAAAQIERVLAGGAA